MKLKIEQILKFYFTKILFFSKDARLPEMLQRAMAAEAEASREARAKVMKTDATIYFLSHGSIFKGDCCGRGDESLEGPEGGLADHRAIPSSAAAQIPSGQSQTSQLMSSEICQCFAEIIFIHKVHESTCNLLFTSFPMREKCKCFNNFWQHIVKMKISLSDAEFNIL